MLQNVSVSYRIWLEVFEVNIKEFVIILYNLYL
jgi:hypothetical protein